MPLGKGGEVRKGTGTKKAAQSKSAKAGLFFPVARINRRMMENKTTKRVGAGAPVYATAIVEYFTAEILELAINEMKSSGGGRSRIMPTDVLRAVRNDAAVHKATNGLRIMVGDKAKDTSELIMSKSDAEVRMVNKMNESADWFEIDAEQTVERNYKRYLDEFKERQQKAREDAEAEAEGR